MNLLHNIDVQIDDFTVNNISRSLENCSISLYRCSCDTAINRAGSKLVDLCKNNEIVVLNNKALTSSYKKFGKLTFKDTSEIDYVIARYPIVELCSSFCVGDFCVLMSDVRHCEKV